MCAPAGGRNRAPFALRALLLLVLTLCGGGTFRSASAAVPPPPTRMFWVAHASGWAHVRLQELAASAHLHLYAPASAHLSASQVSGLVTAFESRILPTDTRIFGSPAHLTPVDVALVSLDPVTLGYFDQSDVDPNGPYGDPAHSNHANVLFSRLPAAMPDANKLVDTEEVLAHELQHLIEYRLRVMQRHLVPQVDWLNEGLSFFAQVANGFWTPRDVLKVDAACGNPSWPVTELDQNMSFLRHNARTAYGRAGLFVTYLAARFGTEIAQKLVSSPETGVRAVADQIHFLDARQNLGSVFADWGVAQYLRGRGVFGYGPYVRSLHSIPGLALPEVASYPFDSRAAIALRPWSQAYLEFATHGGQNLRIRVAAPAASVRVAAIVEDSTGSFAPRVEWASPRKDGSITFRLDSLADLYNRVIIVVNAEPATGAASPAAIRVEVRAALVNVSDNDGSPRLAATTSGDTDLTLG